MKFDGSIWTEFPTNPEGMVSKYVLCIATDRHGNKWFGTQDGGVSEFDRFFYVAPIVTSIPENANNTGSIKITSDVNWIVDSNQSWISPNKKSGNYNDVITLTSTANKTTSARIATITVNGINVTPKSILITQAAGSPDVVVKVAGPDLTVFPVPVKNNLIVSPLDPGKHTHIEIYTINSNTIFSTNIKSDTCEIDMTKYPPGVYVIKITTENTTITRKIIKQ